MMRSLLRMSRGVGVGGAPADRGTELMSTNDMSATASTVAMTTTSKISGKSTATTTADVAPTPHTIPAVVIDEDENEDMGGASGKNSAAPVTPSPTATDNSTRNTHNPTPLAASGVFPFDEHDEIMRKSTLTGASSNITPPLQEPMISWRGHKKHTRVTTSTTTTTTTNLRDSSDIRSPGVCATPLSETTTTTTSTTKNSIPDFITQTDAHGNPVAPVTPTAPSRTTWLVEEENDETENSYFEPLRVMCCCLSLEDDGGGGGSAGGTTPKSKLNSSKSTPSTTSTSLVVTPPSAINTKYILPPPKHHDKKCLVLDLDETLVHSSFRVVPNVDFVIPVTVDSTVHSVYVAKRPHVDQFLKDMAEHYELVIYTASLNKYADPLLDLLDPHRVIAHRLFREHCVYYEGHYVKDLRLLNRPLSKTIIVDNSPNSYLFHPENAIDCTSFIDDRRDEELLIIADFLKGVKHVEDVRHFCNIWRGWPNVEISTAVTTSSVRIETDNDDDEDTNLKPKNNTTKDGNETVLNKSNGRQNSNTADISLSVCALISDEWFV